MKRKQLRVREIRENVFILQHETLFGWGPWELNVYDFPIEYYSLLSAKEALGYSIKRLEFIPNTRAFASVYVW